MTGREKAIFLHGLDFGMRLILQGELRTQNNDDLHDLARTWYAMTLEALGLGLEHERDQALVNEIDQALSGVVPVSARPPSDRN
jgi:hypothetical protein